MQRPLLSCPWAAWANDCHAPLPHCLLCSWLWLFVLPANASANGAPNQGNLVLLGPLLLPQALLQASVELPSGASCHYPAQDVTLVAYYADATADSGRKLMPVALNFHQYWQEVLVGSGAAPALPRKVYRMHPQLAEQGWERRWLYTAAGGVVSRGPEGLLSLHKVSPWLPALRGKMGWSRGVKVVAGTTQ